MPSPDSMKLEPSRGEFRPNLDARPHLPEPPPVRLVAVEDVRLPAIVGQAPQLDAFYAGLLRFEREPAEAALTYKAENFRLHFDVRPSPIRRDDYRAVQIEVPDLLEIEKKLIDLELEYERQRGLSPAHDQLVLTDPAGNWVAIGEFRQVR